VLDSDEGRDAALHKIAELQAENAEMCAAMTRQQLDLKDERAAVIKYLLEKEALRNERDVLLSGLAGTRSAAQKAREALTAIVHQSDANSDGCDDCEWVSGRAASALAALEKELN
jgi:hypothetical protein